MTNPARMVVTAGAFFLLVTAALIARVAITSGSGAPPGNKPSLRPTRAAVTPSPTPSSNTPVHTSPPRITIPLGNTHDLQIATGFDSFLMVSSEIATGVAKNRFSVGITALKIGETMMLATYGTRRQTYIIEVVAKPRGDARRNGLTDLDGVSQKPPALTGSFTTTFARGSGGGTSLLREKVDFRQTLSKERTLRVSGEMFKLFGGADSELAIARVRNFALNRLSVGLDTADRMIDVLDSQVNISPMSLNSYTMRGFHLAGTPKPGSNANFRKKGIEIYAGLARPSLAFFDTNGGMVAGAMVPVFTKDNFQARAGFAAVSADRNSREATGGVVAQADAVYAPTKEISVHGETSFANGDLSWRARLDLSYVKYGGSAEITRFARSSPLNSIGAQSGERKTELLSFYWRPVARINTSAGYNHTQVSRQTNSQFADYDRSLIFANAAYSLTKNSRINLRYTDQKIKTAFRGGLTSLDIQTRTVSAGHSIRFNRNFSNTFEASLNFDKERRSNEGLENGFSLREQLRISWKGANLTGFLNYTNKTPSLTSLIVRNPQLLPALLQTAFALDPYAFLRAYRDRFAFLLGGVELPLTRSLDGGVQFQKTFSRFTVSAEARYNAGEIYAVNQKNLSTSAGVGIRLDAANSIRVDGWKSFGANARSSVTVSYTHQFGSSGDGFQFSRLLGFNRGTVRGRVFYDLNGNGISDAGEPGLAGMKIQVDGNRYIATGSDGRYEFTGHAGRHRVVLVSGELGVRLLASTPTEQSVNVDGRQKLDLNFGVRDHGSVSGRVFNDSDPLRGPQTHSETGLSGIRVIIRSIDTGFGSSMLEQVSAADGTYSFVSLRPGRYLIEVDPMTLPDNFRVPAVTSSSIIVEPLHGSSYDVPLAAERAVTGVVFIDADGDGRYTYGKDEPIEGARVTINDNASITDQNGAYILRHLPAGRMNLVVVPPGRVEGTSYFVVLGIKPVTQRAHDLRIDHR